MLNDYPDVLTVKDVMVILRMGKNTVYRLLKNGDIRCRQIGNKYLIPKRCVMDYLNSIRYRTV